MSDPRSREAAEAGNDPAAESHSPPTGEPLASESIGTYLAGHRELRGISLDQLSLQTRIPLRSLERLERGAFDGQADGFARGFVRTVADALGLDPDETVTRMQPEPGRDSARRSIPRLSLSRVLLSGALVAGAALILVLADAAFDRAGAGVSASAPGMVRRDPVRALAEAQGVEGLQERAAVMAGSRRRERGAASWRSPEIALDPAAARARAGTR